MRRNGARLIVFLHGSNMNGLDYLRSFEAKKWCEDDILCCPNGENGTDPFGQNNFGFDSAPLVADVTEEVQKAFKTTITYVGGHSQGAFLTYSVILNFPDLYRGAFPMAGDCWMQNEPNLWEDKPEVLKKQKEIAIAVIHGKADPVVAFSQGEHAYDCFRAMGWTKLRLFAPTNLNHMFMLAPVDEAIEWLDAMNGRNEQKSAEPRGEVGQGRRVGMGLAHRQGLEVGRGRAAEIGRGRRGEGRPRDDGGAQRQARGLGSEVGRVLARLRRDERRETARRKLPRSNASSSARPPLRLFNESQVLFRSRKRDDAFKVLEKLRDEGPIHLPGLFRLQVAVGKKVTNC